MRALDRLRLLATSARVVVVALVNLVSGRVERSDVVLAPGDPAPDFTLPGSDGCLYRLSDFRNRDPVVLAWFPKAFTPGCTAECRSLEAGRPALEALGARYFGISTDDRETNRRFAASIDVNYPILSDADGSVARAYGVVGPTGYPSRWTFYIAPDGRITAIDKAVRVSSHGGDIAARLELMRVSGRDG